MLAGRDLLACAAVCRTWLAIIDSSSDIVEDSIRRLEPCPARTDLIQLLGGCRAGMPWRRYLAFRLFLNDRRAPFPPHPDAAPPPPERLVLQEERSAEGGSADVLTVRSFALGPDGAVSAAPSAPPLVLYSAAQQPLPTLQATWSPCGRYLAYVHFSERHAPEGLDGPSAHWWPVIKVHSRMGHVAALVVDAASDRVPFYLYWSPCSTVLCLLSTWPDGAVAMRVADLGPSLLADYERAKGGGAPVAPMTLAPTYVLSARPCYVRADELVSFLPLIASPALHVITYHL